MPSYPTVVDTFPTLDSSSYMDDTAGGLDGPTVINKIQAAVAALETKVGTTASTDHNSVDFLLQQLSGSVTLDSSSRPHIITTAGGTMTLTYDASGNVSNIAGTGYYKNVALTYDSNGNLSTWAVS